MVRHTLSPQPHAVERKNKHPSDEAESNLAGKPNKNKKATQEKIKDK